MILINGNFLCRNLTGIERYAWEVCKRLDELLSVQEGEVPVRFALLVPANAKKVPCYGRIELIHSAKAIKGFPFWDLGVFARECRRRHALALDFSNTAPLGRHCGIAFLHDIYAADCPEDFVRFKDKLIRAYSRLNYANICRHAQKIITVSEFSSQQIQKRYKVSASRIAVIGNGWEHISEIADDDGIFSRFPRLEHGSYYFTLGSLSRRKNLSWIARYASAHPEELFAVSGRAISGLVPPELEVLKSLPNVVLVGYVSDAEVKALMRHCKAFVFPSYYEGFGIPPLEALAVGAKVVVAKAASLPEIYGATVHYIDPCSTDCHLEALLAEPLSLDAKELLSRYSYAAAAESLYGLCLAEGKKVTCP